MAPRSRSSMVAGAVVCSLLLLLGSVGAQQSANAIDWLANNPDTTTAAALLKAVVTKPLPPKAKLTLFAPTNKAIDTFLKDMGLTKEQFMERKGLADLVLAYHVVPGYQATELKLKKSPAVAVTGDINYVLKFTELPGGKGVQIEDVQGNTVDVSAKPVVVNGVSIVIVDRVLMSGSYFTNGQEALSYYPQWGEAAKFAAAAGFPAGVASGRDLTLFVPDDAAFKAARTAGLSKEQMADIVQYHAITPARFIPSQFKSGQSLNTALDGHSLRVDVATDSSKTDEVTGKANAIPTVTVIPETGKPAKVNIYNIYAGRGIFQGVDGLLMPKLSSGSSKDSKDSTKDAKPEAGKKDAAKDAAKPAAAKATEAGTATTATTKAAAASKPAEPAAATATTGRRMLLGRGGGRGHESNNGYSQMYANTVSMDNTQRAIEAAAAGTIPTSYATRYGSANAKAAAYYGDGCWNCNRW